MFNINEYFILFFIFFPIADYEGPKTTINSKARAPSPPTIRVGHNRLDAPRVTQSVDTVTSNTATAPVLSLNDTVRSTVSTGSFDYLRGPRRCVLKVDRNKGLGFVLSATGDYDHTITAVEKVSNLNSTCVHRLYIFVFLLFDSIQQPIPLVYKLMMNYGKSMVLMSEMLNMSRYVFFRDL
jgi:hypothetical protein